MVFVSWILGGRYHISLDQAPIKNPTEGDHPSLVFTIDPSFGVFIFAISFTKVKISSLWLFPKANHHEA